MTVPPRIAKYKYHTIAVLKEDAPQQCHLMHRLGHPLYHYLLINYFRVFSTTTNPEITKCYLLSIPLQNTRKILQYYSVGLI